MTVEILYVYTGQHQCGKTFPLSTRVVQIVCQKAVGIPFKVPEGKGRRKKKAAPITSEPQEVTVQTHKITFLETFRKCFTCRKKFLSPIYETDLCCVACKHQGLLRYFLCVECKHVVCFICKPVHQCDNA